LAGRARPGTSEISRAHDQPLGFSCPLARLHPCHSMGPAAGQAVTQAVYPQTSEFVIGSNSFRSSPVRSTAHSHCSLWAKAASTAAAPVAKRFNSQTIAGVKSLAAIGGDHAPQRWFTSAFGLLFISLALHPPRSGDTCLPRARSARHLNFPRVAPRKCNPRSKRVWRSSTRSNTRNRDDFCRRGHPRTQMRHPRTGARPWHFFINFWDFPDDKTLK